MPETNSGGAEFQYTFWEKRSQARNKSLRYIGIYVILLL